MVLGILRFLMLVENTGVEDGFDALIDQPLHMAMSQLGRITLGFGGDGLHTQFINLSVRVGGQYNPEAQLFEEGGPEGIILIHIQHSGDAQAAPGCLFFGQRLVGIEDPLALKINHIAPLFTCYSVSRALFTPVAADMLSTAEIVDGQQTTVSAATAADGGGFIRKTQHFLKRQHGAFLTSVMVLRNQSRTKSTHQTGNVRASSIHTGDFLKGPENCLVVKGAALNNDMLAQILGICKLDDLVERVFDDGVGKTCRNVGNRGSFFLGLLDVGVHEYCATGTQVNGSFCKQGFLCKALSGVTQAGCEVFYEGAAAGTTGFVQHDGIHSSVL